MTEQLSSERHMKLDLEYLTTDERSVLRFLKNWPEKYISSNEIARRADGKNRYRQEPRWPAQILPQLIAMNLVETDGSGKYRVRNEALKTVKLGGRKRFIAPRLRAILEKHGSKFELSA